MGHSARKYVDSFELNIRTVNCQNVMKHAFLKFLKMFLTGVYLIRT